MESHDAIYVAWAKVAIAWIGIAVGGLTLSSIALVMTIGFTLLQSYILIRRLRREIRLEKLEAKLKHEDKS